MAACDQVFRNIASWLHHIPCGLPECCRTLRGHLALFRRDAAWDTRLRTRPRNGSGFKFRRFHYSTRWDLGGPSVHGWLKFEHRWVIRNSHGAFAFASLCERGPNPGKPHTTRKLGVQLGKFHWRAGRVVTRCLWAFGAHRARTTARDPLPPDHRWDVDASRRKCQAAEQDVSGYRVRLAVWFCTGEIR
jgi:hypothetical protein